MAKPDVDYTKHSEYMGEKLYGKFTGPTKNFRADWAYDMPETIDPESWKAISTEEWKAHHERQAIRGRLRRQFWTKAYHPVNWKYFNPVTSDPMWAKFQKAKGVYFIRDNFKPAQSTRVILQIFTVLFVIPSALMTYAWKKTFQERKYLSALDPRTNE